MSQTRKINGYLFSIIACALLCGPISQSANAQGPLYGHTRSTKVTKKLWRGVGNVTFGWVEVPWSIHKSIQDLDPFTGTFVGFAKGSKKGFSRTVAGVSEIVTFPFSSTVPLPFLSMQRDFSPVYTPEFVLQDMFDPSLLDQLPTTPKKRKQRRAEAR